MVDKCEPEMNAIKSLFPDSKVLLCSFHREQSWGRWLRAEANGFRANSKEALELLRAIASAETEEKCEEAINDLKSWEFWKKSESFRNWFNPWLEMQEFWVTAYRLYLMEIVVDTNNGVERKNRDFKYEFLKKFLDYSLSGMINVLVTVYGPESYARYVQSNIKSSSKYAIYDASLPIYMCDQPKKVCEFLQKRYSTMQNEISVHNIGRLTDSEFSVQGKTGLYSVSLGNDVEHPSCSCFDWKRHKLPCKHMLAILEHVDGVSW